MRIVGLDINTVPWIKAFKDEIEAVSAEHGSDPHAPISVKLNLGDARRLLHVLELATSPDGDDGANNARLVEEVCMLVLGVCEG